MSMRSKPHQRGSIAAVFSTECETQTTVFVVNVKQLVVVWPLHHATKPEDLFADGFEGSFAGN